MLNKKTCKNCQEMYTTNEIDENKPIFKELINSLIANAKTLDYKQAQNLKVEATILEDKIKWFRQDILTFQNFDSYWTINGEIWCPSDHLWHSIFNPPPIDCPFLHKHFNNKDI